MPGINFKDKSDRVFKNFYHLGKQDTDDKGNSTISIIKWDKENGNIKYNGLQGYLIDIAAREDEYNDKPLPKLVLTLTNEEGEIDEFTCGRYTGFARGILNALAGVESIKAIRITPYLGTPEGSETSFTNVSVRHAETIDGLNDKETKIKGIYKYSNDLKYPTKAENIPVFVENCKKNGVYPSTHYVEVVGQSIKITKEQEAFFDSLIPDIKSKISYSYAAPVANSPEEHLAPDEDNDPDF